uniref:OX-2 membrane glycoprotein-like n=1 Tax=Semicossyphus pulcher TaxID=241346 RepID=UPI0037E85676
MCAMCGPALPLCLLLWIGGTAVSRTQGQVLAPARLTVEAGQPLQLGCNITTAPGDSIRQVRWLNKYSKVILAYEQSAPLRISLQDPNVKLTASNNQASYITIKRIHPDDEGCFRCVFDVFPKGAQDARTCVSVTGRVRQEGNKTAVNGKPATLSCWYSIPKRVQQVMWRKTAEQGDTTMVAYFARHGRHNMGEQFVGRVSLSETLGDTQLTIQEVRTEDEACYTCEFHTYPGGTMISTACLFVYVLPKPEVNHATSPLGVTEANCTAQSRPAADITWDVGGENRTLGPPITTSYDQGDGTTIVTSTLLLQSALFSDLSVKCIVHHPGLEKPLSVSLNTDVGPATVILVSVCGVAAVLLLCLCVCLCKRFICTDD